MLTEYTEHTEYNKAFPYNYSYLDNPLRETMYCPRTTDQVDGPAPANQALQLFRAN